MTMSETDRRNKERELNDLSRDFQRKRAVPRGPQPASEQKTPRSSKGEQGNQADCRGRKYDLIVQDVVWVSPKLDITEKVIKVALGRQVSATR